MKKKNEPWYTNYEYYTHYSYKYLDALQARINERRFKAEFDSFKYLSSYRLVFESNLIENEGASYGQTKKIVEECFPKIPSNYSAFRAISQINPNPLDTFASMAAVEKMVETINKYQTDLLKIRPSISFANKTKEFFEVLNHYCSINEAELISLRFYIK